jgi:TrmH family RNA methyltransferase
VTSQAILARFIEARADPTLAVLEGFHALKHALRFNAEVLEVVGVDAGGVKGLAFELAPDISRYLNDHLVEVPGSTFGQITRFPPATGVVSIARRPTESMDEVLNNPGQNPVVFLEEPSNLWNVGTVIRVAAAAGSVSVITSGEHDPWHPAALRAATGLHFAVPVFRANGPPICGRPLVAIHPDGDVLPVAEIPERAILAFGTERGGLSRDLLRRANTHVAIPMEEGVSSLNVATAVSVILYAWRLSRT